MSKRGLWYRIFRRQRHTSEAATPERYTINDLRVGDVIVLLDYAPEYDTAMLEVRHIHRYTGNSSEWWEAVAVDRDHRVRIEWSGAGEELEAAASTEFEPLGLEAMGITEADLEQLDDEHSLENRLRAGGRSWRYRNSHEAFYHKDGAAIGVGFYLWDLLAEDGTEVMAVTKFENTPFQVHVSTVIDPEAVDIYPGAAHDPER